MRVAVASGDGKYVNPHFGHEQQFLIFDVDPGKIWVSWASQDVPCHL